MLGSGLLGLLSAGHGITGGALLAAAAGMIGGLDAAGILAGIFYGFFGLLLLGAALAGLRLAWRLLRGDATAAEPATFLLIGYAVINLLSPVGGGPFLVALAPDAAVPLRVVLSGAALFAIWLVRRSFAAVVPPPDPRSPRSAA